MNRSGFFIKNIDNFINSKTIILKSNIKVMLSELKRKAFL